MKNYTKILFCCFILALIGVGVFNTKAYALGLLQNPESKESAALELLIFDKLLGEEFSVNVNLNTTGLASSTNLLNATTVYPALEFSELVAIRKESEEHNEKAKEEKNKYETGELIEKEKNKEEEKIEKTFSEDLKPATSTVSVVPEVPALVFSTSSEEVKGSDIAFGVAKEVKNKNLSANTATEGLPYHAVLEGFEYPKSFFRTDQGQKTIFWSLGFVLAGGLSMLFYRKKQKF